MPWATFEKNGYLESFPDQMGSVHTFRGDERQHAELLRRTEAHEDRGPLLETTDMVLCPAVCHPLYPTMGGRLPEGGRRVEVYGYCFRHEPSTDPFRMQSFRQHDYVYLGTPEGARAHRDDVDRPRARGALRPGPGGGVGGGQRPVLRPARSDAGRQPAHRGAEVRDRGAGVRHRRRRRPSPRRTATSTTSAGPSASTSARRRGGPHGVLRLRGRPDHPGAPRPPRHPTRRVARPGPDGLWP